MSICEGNPSSHTRCCTSKSWSGQSKKQHQTDDVNFSVIDLAKMPWHPSWSLRPPTGAERNWSRRPVRHSPAPCVAPSGHRATERRLRGSARRRTSRARRPEIAMEGKSADPRMSQELETAKATKISAILVEHFLHIRELVVWCNTKVGGSSFTLTCREKENVHPYGRERKKTRFVNWQKDRFCLSRFEIGSIVADHR